MRPGQQSRAAVIECAYEPQYYLSTAKDIKVRHVHMMCPSSISRHSAWGLEERESIVAFCGVDTDQTAVVYRTSVASYKIGELDLRKKKQARVLYSTHHLQMHSPEASNTPYDEVGPQLFAPLWTR